MIERYSRKEIKSIWDDFNKYSLWLEIELAAAEAMEKLKIIPKGVSKKVRLKAKINVKRILQIENKVKHDVIAFLTSITEKVGKEARYLHKGMTSSDVLDTCFNLQLKQSGIILLKDLDDLLFAIKRQALKHKNTLCIGRSHGIHAEPMSFGLKLALWYAEFKRHKLRLESVKGRVSVGMLSGPVGNFSSIPPDIEEKVCEKLGISIDPITNQVIQRDRHAEYIQVLALIAASLEKIATEIRGLQRTEVRELEEPFGTPGYVTKGSSSMPHKRNPELSERICGLSRLIRGHSITALENVSLWHERDISHSSAERLILPDSSIALDYILHLTIGIIKDMVVYPDRMLENLESNRGLVFSPRVMLKLVENGLDRDDAYDIVQRHSMETWDKNLDFRDLLLKDRKVLSVIDKDELNSLFDYNFYLEHVNEIYNRLGIR